MQPKNSQIPLGSKCCFDSGEWDVIFVAWLMKKSNCSVKQEYRWPRKKIPAYLKRSTKYNFGFLKCSLILFCCFWRPSPESLGLRSVGRSAPFFHMSEGLFQVTPQTKAFWLPPSQSRQMPMSPFYITMASQQAQFCLPGATWQCMVTFLVVTTRWLCHWHLAGRAQGCC